MISGTGLGRIGFDAETVNRGAGVASEESYTAEIVATRTGRRLAVLGAAALMLAIVFALATRYSDSDDAVELLYLIPVAIVGFEFGLGAGVLAAATALGLMGASAAMHQPEVDPVGFATRAVAIACVAVLAGRFGERRRAQAALGAELEHMRARIGERLHDARSLLDHHEAERGEIARHLHEQAAQTLAAGLMTLSMLDRDAGEASLDRSQVGALRAHMRDCLGELRELADSLRPAALAELGLPAALEGICATASERSGRPVALHADGLAERRPSPGVEATAYRTVEEALAALTTATDVCVVVDDESQRLRIAIAAGVSDRDLPEKLAATRARLRILDGSLRIDATSREGAPGTRIEADFPLDAGV
jgi:signal transduction histidine kinase